jgi:site-specific recombinase XerD
MTDDLQPITPREAVEMYLKDRDIATSTRRAHRRRLKRLVRWCDDEGLTNLNDLTGRDIHQFKIEEFDSKENGGDYSKETIRSVMDTIRVFTRWCASIDAISSGLSEKVQSPSPENVRSETLERNRAETILSYLNTYEYASVRHCLTDLLWHAGFRLGEARALDLEDVNLDQNYVEIVHRPDEDTPLKNGEDGQRLVNISRTTATVIRDYIGGIRDEVIDDYGRKPLLTSQHGRRSRTNLRYIVYSVTRPCVYTNDCPHDREIQECDPALNTSIASQCPSSVYPHALRRGSITWHLREKTPKHLVSDRMDVSPDVLDKHYDARSDEERMRQRRDYLPFGDEDEENR